jgi:hypothetical protein
LVSEFGGIIAMVTEKSYSGNFLVLFVPFAIGHHHRITRRTPSIRMRICGIGVAIESKARTAHQVLANKRGVAIAMVPTFNFFVSVTQIRNVVIRGIESHITSELTRRREFNQASPDQS